MFEHLDFTNQADTMGMNTGGSKVYGLDLKRRGITALEPRAAVRTDGHFWALFQIKSNLSAFGEGEREVQFS